MRQLLSSAIDNNMIKRFLFIPIIGILVFTLVSSRPGETENDNFQVSSEELIKHFSDSSKLTYCYTCHNPDVASHEDMIAPPLFGIKNHYLQSTNGRDEFINNMTAFIMNPTEETALMKGPVRRFGLMPRHELTEDQVRSIVTFIHDNEIPAPAWYESHHKKKHGNSK